MLFGTGDRGKIFFNIMELLTKKLKMALLINLLLFLGNCTFVKSTISVEVPNGYIGWCYLIPVKDTTNMVFSINDGNYTIDENGIAYIPATLLNLKEDNRVIVYDTGVDISDAMRYAGNVSQVTENGRSFKFIRFYIPTIELREIPDNNQYWRDKRYEYTQSESIRFDSLLSKNKILFK